MSFPILAKFSALIRRTGPKMPSKEMRDVGISERAVVSGRENPKPYYPDPVPSPLTTLRKESKTS